MSKCDDCKQEMKTAESCDFPFIIIDGIVMKRNTKHYDVGERCHDCGILNKEGNIHHCGCDMEICPKCENQLIMCDCKKEGIYKIKPKIRYEIVPYIRIEPVDETLYDSKEEALKDLEQMEFLQPENKYEIEEVIEDGK